MANDETPVQVYQSVPIVYDGQEVGILWGDNKGRIYAQFPDSENPVMFNHDHPLDVIWLRNWMLTRFADSAPAENMRTYASGRHDALKQLIDWAQRQIH